MHSSLYRYSAYGKLLQRTYKPCSLKMNSRQSTKDTLGINLWDLFYVLTNDISVHQVLRYTQPVSLYGQPDDLISFFFLLLQLKRNLTVSEQSITN